MLQFFELWQSSYIQIFFFKCNICIMFMFCDGILMKSKVTTYYRTLPFICYSKASRSHCGKTVTQVYHICGACEIFTCTIFDGQIFHRQCKSGQHWFGANLRRQLQHDRFKRGLKRSSFMSFHDPKHKSAAALTGTKG